MLFCLHSQFSLYPTVERFPWDFVQDFLEFLLLQTQCDVGVVLVELCRSSAETAFCRQCTSLKDEVYQAVLGVSPYR